MIEYGKYTYIGDVSKLTGNWQDEQESFIKNFEKITVDSISDDLNDFCFNTDIFYRAIYAICIKLGYAPIIFICISSYAKHNSVIRCRTPEDTIILKFCWDDFKYLK